MVCTPPRVSDVEHHQHTMTVPGLTLSAEPSAHYLKSFQCESAHTLPCRRKVLTNRQEQCCCSSQRGDRIGPSLPLSPGSEPWRPTPLLVLLVLRRKIAGIPAELGRSRGRLVRLSARPAATTRRDAQPPENCSANTSNSDSYRINRVDLLARGL